MFCLILVNIALKSNAYSLLTQSQINNYHIECVYMLIYENKPKLTQFQANLKSNFRTYKTEIIQI